ncbi:MAG: hypothetical protein IKK28_15205 [Mogibacterium sp.]|nr:hypothetical protein [Mogibacterium sp.]
MTENNETEIRRHSDRRMLQDIELEVHHRSFAPDKKKCVPVVQHTHFIRSHQFPTTLSSDEFNEKRLAM